MQSAAVRPDPTYFRKAAIAYGAALDHSGEVSVEPIPGFDLDRTIFQTLQGRLERAVTADRIGKEVHWSGPAARRVQADYVQARAAHQLPDLSPELLQFLVDECDFDVEHADGSFLDHLYFGFEYSAAHYPERSPLVMFLHSILGTGTNTFAMDAVKISTLRGFLDDFDWRQIEAFPSVLRLLHLAEFRAGLRARAGSLREARFRRVIDNQPITMSGDELWTALNFQLIHLVDFLPAANWQTHQNDTSFVLFRELHELLQHADRLEAKVAYSPATGGRTRLGERPTLLGRIADRAPVSVTAKMAEKSIRRFSTAIGHDLEFEFGSA